MRIFISGGCGQVGSHTADLLLARGDEVLAVDNFATGRRVHLPDQHKNLTFVEGHIADKALMYKLIGDFKPDVIIHTAVAYKDPDDWVEDALTNTTGGAVLIRAAMELNVGRFIYFQTALMYGLQPQEQPITLTHPHFSDNSSYSISKTPTEYYLGLSGLDFVSFRLANVVGPRNVSGPLPIFYKRLKEGKKCFVTDARRDFVFGKDLARGVLKAVDGSGSGPYHFSSGKDVAVIELYNEVVKALKMGEYPEPEIRPLGDDDVASILLDPTKTIKDFGDLGITPLDELVTSAIEYYDEYGVEGGYTHLRHDEKIK
jgi:nucleoside-diphosphate-sugar epimerase